MDGKVIGSREVSHLMMRCVLIFLKILPTEKLRIVLVVGHVICSEARCWFALETYNITIHSSLPWLTLSPGEGETRCGWLLCKDSELFCSRALMCCHAKFGIYSFLEDSVASIFSYIPDILVLNLQLLPILFYFLIKETSGNFV